MDTVIEVVFVIAVAGALIDRVWTWWKKRNDPAEAAAQAAPPKKMTERDYQNLVSAQLQADGLENETEFVLPCGARIDVSTKCHAIEIDFPHKWAECIGQALYYASQTGKAPVCLLIVDPTKDEPGINRCVVVCKLYRIQVWMFFTSTLTLQR